MEQQVKARAGGSRSVCVVIPTHNNLELLRPCLQAVRQLDYPEGQLSVIVVDNGSTDGTCGAVHAPTEGVKCLRLERNTGFAEACNRGAAEAGSDYVAFLNDDALPDKNWLNGLFSGLDAGGEGAVCSASRILSGDGSEIEYNGASANLFGVGRPRSVWGWPDAPQPPSEGSPLLFASGGAMLVHRRTFLDVGGFDPSFFAYFEDVDLGWRLWALGYRVVYAPAAVVRHIGGATGRRQPAYRRYTLWECNSLATVLKNYEGGNMERILAAALMLLYKRALLATGDSFQPAHYTLTAPPDNNITNVEQLPRISVAHLAAIDRFNSLLPHFMQERRRIQALRTRPDSEILPLLGRPWEAQFAGAGYAETLRGLAASLDLYGITNGSLPNRVLLLAGADDGGVEHLAASLAGEFLVALAVLQGSKTHKGSYRHSSVVQSGYVEHQIAADDPALHGLAQQADALLVFPGALRGGLHTDLDTPTALVGEEAAPGLPGAARLADVDSAAIRAFCRTPRASLQK